jgi:hypothetical protein
MFKAEDFFEKEEKANMIIWEAWGQTEIPLRQYFTNKKEALAWIKEKELEDATIEKIEISGRRDMANQLNFLADMMNQ